jgi:hypothetical protein
MSKDKRFEREQGDINTTANRRKYNIFFTKAFLPRC